MIFVVICLIGCSLSGLIANTISHIQTEKVALDYQRKIEIFAGQIEKEFKLKLEVLYAFQMLYASSGEISAQEFAYASKLALARHADIKAIEWVPYVGHEQRTQFEKSNQQRHPNFKITAKNSEGELVLADIKPFYFPVHYIEPLQGNEAAVGFDLSSEPERLATLEKAEALGKEYASSPITLIQAEDEGLGLIISLPLFSRPFDQYQTDEHNIKGYIILVFQLNVLFEQALSKGLIGHHKIQLHDITNLNESPRLLSEIVFPTAIFEALTAKSVIHDLAARTWQVTAVPAKESISEQMGHSSLMILSIGCLFSVLTAWFVYHLNMSTLRTRLQVVKQTKESNSSKHFLEEITNAVPTLLAYVDEKLTYQFMNKTYERWYKKPQDSVIGQSIYQDLGDEAVAKLQSYVQKTMSGEVSRFVSTHQVSQGPRHTRSSFTPNFNHKGDVVGFYVAIEDISQQKESEEKLQEHALELEFQTWALEDSKDKAEAATRIKSEFLANMSHEIRTPMNGVLGMLALLKKSELKDKQARYVDLAELSASTLLTLINDILDFSKVEAGKLVLENKDFNLHELLKTFGDLTQIKTQEKGLTFSLLVADAVPKFVIGDEVRINQILTNLTSNAIKFTSSGAIKIVINLIETQANFHRIQIEVHDTGIGIAEKNMAHLFDAFRQENSSTTREFGGTGLGLAISKNLAELMQGHIVVASEKNKGTCFTVELCLGLMNDNVLAELALNAEAEVNIENQVITANPTESVNKNRNKHILLVEDNYVNQVVASEILKGMGFTLDIADNGLIAIKLLETQPEGFYQFILMDCLMPEMDGFAATRNIRTNDKVANGQGIPIIAMTANAMKGDREQCINAGMDDYLSKPIDPQILADVLAKWQS